MNRGVIAAPATLYADEGTFRANEILTPKDIRYLILYWDRVVVPTNDVYHIKLPAENALLETGIVFRPSVSFTGSFSAEAMMSAQLLSQLDAAKYLIENDRNTDWVLHQKGNRVVIPEDDSVKKNIIRFDLVNCLPVPLGSVSFDDIMKFKESRKDELAQLHIAIDELYFEALSSPDPSLKSKKTVQNFENSILALEKTTTEKWKKTVKFDISAELNLDGKDVATGVAAGAVFDFYTNLYTVPIGTIVGAAASLFKVKAKSSKTLVSSKNKNVLSYLAAAHEESILRITN